VPLSFAYFMRRTKILHIAGNIQAEYNDCENDKPVHTLMG
jgi:hypothetical protein